MAFQSAVNIYNTVGFPGNLAFSGPIRSGVYNLNSSAQAQIVGYAYTLTNGGANPNPAAGSPNMGNAKVGGTGIFAGILTNPKELPSYGTSNNPLAPSLIMPDNTNGELLIMGEVWVVLAAAANDGDLAYYDNTSGAIGAVAPTATFTGVIAPGATDNPDVLTVSAISAGFLSVGSVITGAGVAPGTYIAALDGGTGGNGTYFLNTIATQTVGSEAMTGTTISAPAGKTFIPNGTIWRYVASDAGLAVLKLTN